MKTSKFLDTLHLRELQFGALLRRRNVPGLTVLATPTTARLWGAVPAAAVARRRGHGARFDAVLWRKSALGSTLLAAPTKEWL